MKSCINSLIDDEAICDEALLALLHQGYAPNEWTLLTYLSRNFRKAPRYDAVNPRVVHALIAHGATPYLMEEKEVAGELQVLPTALCSTLNLAVMIGNQEIIEALLAVGDRINRYTLRYVGSSPVFRFLFAKGAQPTFEDCLLHESACRRG